MRSGLDCPESLSDRELGVVSGLLSSEGQDSCTAITLITTAPQRWADASQHAARSHPPRQPPDHFWQGPQGDWENDQHKAVGALPGSCPSTTGVLLKLPLGLSCSAKAAATHPAVLQQ